jgi:hypothetical protein
LYYINTCYSKKGHFWGGAIVFGISKPSNIEKEQLKPLVTEFFQHYIKMKDILNELPRFSSDEAVGSVLSDRAKLNEKRARTRSDLYKALEEITFMRECTSSITKVWPKGKYLTEKMYQLLADGKNYILNLLKMDEFWNASNDISSEDLASMQKPYISEIKKLEKRANETFSQVADMWQSIYTEGLDFDLA